MKFTRPELAHQFAVLLHEETRKVAEEFDRWTVQQGMPEAVVTAISRDAPFYTAKGLRKPKFSWHFTDCAVDFRNRHYTPAQKQKCRVWLKQRLTGSQWEVVLKDHGTGPHFHIAYRDFSRRREWEARHAEMSA